MLNTTENKNLTFLSQKKKITIQLFHETQRTQVYAKIVSAEEELDNLIDKYIN